MISNSFFIAQKFLRFWRVCLVLFNPFHDHAFCVDILCLLNWQIIKDCTKVLLEMLDHNCFWRDFLWSACGKNTIFFSHSSIQEAPKLIAMLIYGRFCLIKKVRFFLLYWGANRIQFKRAILSHILFSTSGLPFRVVYQVCPDHTRDA